MHLPPVKLEGLFSLTGACHQGKVPRWAGFTCTVGETEAAAEPKELIFKL